MPDKNIFSNIRREIGIDNLFWLHDDYITWDSEEKPIYYGGFRGVGKTTILQSFKWRNRINNISLKNELCKVYGESYEELGDDKYLKDVAFRNKTIGIYHNVLSFSESHFSNWGYKNKLSAYSAYFECVWLSKLIDAISALRNSQVIKFTRTDENLVVLHILDKYPSLKEITEIEEYTLATLKKMFESIFNHIRFRLESNKNLDPVFENFLENATPALGAFLHSITNPLLLLCETKEDMNDYLDHDNGILKETKWRFCICIDYDTMTEIEETMRLKQKLINSIVVAKTPHEINAITYRIAGLVGYLDYTSSFEYPLNEADRKYLEMHTDLYKSSEKFQKFVDGVLRVRIKSISPSIELPNDFESLNVLKRILGDKTLNERTLDLNKDNFKKINNRHFLNEVNKYTKTADRIPSLWEYYVNTKLEPDSHNRGMNFNRGMNVSATLCLCNEYNLYFPYVGYSVLIGLSDKSIRECLQLLNYIYLEFQNQKNGSLDDFLSIEIESTIQHKAIKKYTSHSISDLKAGTHNPNDKNLFYLILSLAEVYHHIQTDINNKAYLSSEKGWFKVHYSSDDYEFIDSINKGADWGCIITNGPLPRMGSAGYSIFRISNRYAAFPPLDSNRSYTDNYNYSYRGASGNKNDPVEISVDNFIRLFNADKEERKRAVKSIISIKLSKKPGTITLNKFFGVEG